METVVILLFVFGYVAITLEHNLKIDKLIPALAMMALCWAVIALGLDGFDHWYYSSGHGNADLHDISGLGHEQRMGLLEGTILHHLGKTAEILFFLMGAMTIVEIIDHFDGFATFKRYIRTRSKRKLLWIFSILAFFLSAIIDNLTATIVLITILQKIISDKNTRLWFAGLIIIGANAGGAWSPIGDVTTTMLWIADKVTAGSLVEHVLLPSIACMAVPTLVASFLPPFQGSLEDVTKKEDESKVNKYSSFMLYLGLGGIIFVPFFKTITHLPPYVGMMLSLAIVAGFAEILSRRTFSMSQINDEDPESTFHSPVHGSLSKIEMPSILFFLGILMAVAAMESLGQLYYFANAMNNSMPMIGLEHNENVSDLVVLMLGVGSAVIDNVPLVAASMGMFTEPTDSPLWHFIAYAAGTGGSMLIIGSAAGVVAMGMEKIDFFWYLKKIAWLALIGFLSGSVIFVILRFFLYT